MRNVGLLSTVLAALAAVGTPLEFHVVQPGSPRRLEVKPRRHVTGYMAPATNGERECARRRRQIASGQLTSANGLVRDAA